MDNREFVIADIPGLIAGAHEGKGIGDRFLGHVERCSVLLHLVDGISDDVVGDYQTIIDELEAYGGHLADKPRVTALNKGDSMDPDSREEALAALREATGGPVFAMSGVSKQGVTEVLRALRAEIDAGKEVPAAEDAAWRP